MTLFERVLAVTPENPLSHSYLAEALLEEGRMADAAPHVRKAIALKPDYVELLNNLAWLLVTNPDVAPEDPGEPLRLATRAVQLTASRNPYPLYTLARVQEREGRLAAAASNAALAASLARSMGNAALAQEAGERAVRLRAQVRE